MRSLRILSTPTAQRSSAPFIAHCLPLPYLCSVQVVPGIPVSHPPPPSHRRSTLSPISMGSLDLGAAQEDRRHSRRRTRSSSGFLLLPCRMGLLAGDILPSHPQVTPSIPRCCHTLSHSSPCPLPDRLVWIPEVGMEFASSTLHVIGVQDMVPPLAMLETRSFLFPIGHSWS
uniref:Uncharacterized protein n=1 Tax=Oryza barthii TaxID=65489 RepID=A0A0D3EMP4_9ORYZ